MIKITCDKLDSEMFEKREDIDEIVLENVRVIPDYCFADCINLKKVTISGELQKIDYDAFYGCVSLEEVVLIESDSSSISIGYKAFENCHSLVSINFFDRVQDISSFAFAKCSKLKNINLGPRLRELSKTSFYGCDYSEITLKNNHNFYIKDRFLIEKTELDKKVGYRALMYLGNESDIKVPREVTYISDFCFRNSNVRKISISPSMYTLDDIDAPNDRFIINEFCSLEEEDYLIPEDISWYLSDILETCESLAAFSVQKGNSKFSVYKGALYSKDKRTLYRVPMATTGLYEVLPGTIEISNYAFSGCKSISEITIPSSLELIGYGAFKNCPFRKMEIKGRNPIFTKKDGIIYEIKQREKILLVCEKNRSEVIIDEDLTDIAPFAFSNCTELERIDLSGLCQLKRVGDHAFYGCNSLQEVIFPDSIKEIEPALFENCTSLRTVRFPTDVKAFGERLFAGCSQSINFYINSADFGVSDQLYWDTDCSITFELGSKTNIAGYHDLFTYHNIAAYTLERSMLEIKLKTGDNKEGRYIRRFAQNGAVYYEISGHIFLIKVPSEAECFSVLPATDTIMTDAFMWCNKISHLYIPDGVKYITDTSFRDCSSCKAIRLPENVKLCDIGRKSFRFTEIYDLSEEKIKEIFRRNDNMKYVYMGDKKYKIR